MGARKQTTQPTVINSFKDLKKTIKRKRAERVLKNEKDPAPVFTDEELFHDSMKEVEEIEDFRKIPVYQKPLELPVRKKSSDSDALKALEDITSGRRKISLADTQEYVEWVDQDYRVDMIEDLHLGKYSVQEYIDLHGFTVEEADKELEYFIRRAVSRGFRCIRIIHGRGLCSPDGPVLKAVVIKRLLGRYRKYVASFVTARQCDGGLGALYVLLK